MPEIRGVSKLRWTSGHPVVPMSMGVTDIDTLVNNSEIKRVLAPFPLIPKNCFTVLLKLGLYLNPFPLHVDIIFDL